MLRDRNKKNFGIFVASRLVSGYSMACERNRPLAERQAMLRFELCDDGTMDTLARCEHCGKVERFDTHSLWEAVSGYDGEEADTMELFKAEIGNALATAGHDSDGCEI